MCRLELLNTTKGFAMTDMEEVAKAIEVLDGLLMFQPEVTETAIAGGIASVKIDGQCFSSKDKPSTLIKDALVLLMGATAVHNLQEAEALEEQYALESLRDEVARRYFGGDIMFSEIGPAVRSMVNDIIARDKALAKAGVAL